MCLAERETGREGGRERELPARHHHGLQSGAADGTEGCESPCALTGMLGVSFKHTPSVPQCFHSLSVIPACTFSTRGCFLALKITFRLVKRLGCRDQRATELQIYIGFIQRSDLGYAVLDPSHPKARV